MGILKDLGKETLKFWTTDSRTAGDVNVENAKQLGYEFICRGYNGGRCAGGLFTKDGGVYYAPRKNSIGSSPGQDLVIENITAVEITKVNEITKNAKLIELEIHFRINGAINSMRASGKINDLLTIADKLGYRG